MKAVVAVAVVVVAVAVVAVVAVAVVVVAVVAVAVIRSALPDREGKGQASCFVIYVYSGPLTD